MNLRAISCLCLAIPAALAGQAITPNAAPAAESTKALLADTDAEAKRRGKHVHMGRVNSLTRLRYADHIGCDSADGTYLVFGPDVNLPKLLDWLTAVNDQGTLWKAG